MNTCPQCGCPITEAMAEDGECYNCGFVIPQELLQNEEPDFDEVIADEDE